MIINYKTYNLELVNGNSFNLTETIRVEKSKKIDKKLVATGEIVDKEVKLGYSMTFDRCLELIINSELSKKNDIISIKDYIKQYKEVKQEILNILK